MQECIVDTIGCREFLADLFPLAKLFGQSLYLNGNFHRVQTLLQAAFSVACLAYLGLHMCQPQTFLRCCQFLCLFASILKLLFESDEPFQPQQLLNSLLPLGQCKHFNTPQLFLLHETGIAQALSIEITQFLEDAFVDSPHARDLFWLRTGLLNSEYGLLRSAALENTSDFQFLPVYLKEQFDGCSRLAVLNDFFLPCLPFFAH